MVHCSVELSAPLMDKTLVLKMVAAMVASSVFVTVASLVDLLVFWSVGGLVV